MTVILNRNESVDDKVMQIAALVLQKQRTTYRVLKQRHGKRRRVLRPDEIETFAANY